MFSNSLPMTPMVLITLFIINKTDHACILNVQEGACDEVIYHITYGPGVPGHSAGYRMNALALVQCRFLFPCFSLITWGTNDVICDDVTL